MNSLPIVFTCFFTHTKREFLAEVLLFSYLKEDKQLHQSISSQKKEKDEPPVWNAFQLPSRDESSGLPVFYLQYE